MLYYHEAAVREVFQMAMQPEQGQAGGYALDGRDYLDGTSVRLRQLEPPDYPFLRQLELRPPYGVLYRHRGLTPGPESYAQSLWAGVLCQFMVVAKPDGRPLGAVAAFSNDYRNGICKVATIIDPDRAAGSAGIEGMRLFVDYLFAVFPIRKVMADVIEFNWPQVSSGAGRLFQLEGVLRDHEYHDGRYWDVRILAIHRAQWASWRERSAETRVGITRSPGEAEVGGFDRFARLLAEELDWPEESLSPEARLVEDLGCDSIALVELAELVNALGPEPTNRDLLLGLATLGEVYRRYGSQLHQGRR